MLVDSSTLLTNLVDRLLRQHRSGIVPMPHQIEDLIDLNARVKRDLVFENIERLKIGRDSVNDVRRREGLPSIEPCDVTRCREAAEVSAEGGRYCVPHADLIERTVAEVRERLHGEAARSVVAAINENGFIVCGEKVKR